MPEPDDAPAPEPSIVDVVELRDIRIFLTLAEELHFGRTADRLVISRPRVSQAIRTLELNVGARLFDRTSRSVGLTPAGEHLRQELQPPYDQLRQVLARARLDRAGPSGFLRLGMYTPVNGGPHLISIIKTVEERHPALRVLVSETSIELDQIDQLRRGMVDVLAMRLPLHDPDVVIGPILSSEERVVMVAKDHPLASKDSVEYEELADYTVPDVTALPPELMDAFVPPRTPSGRLIRRSPVRSPGEAITRAARGELVHPTVASFFDHYRGPDLTCVPITDLPPSETALVWLKERSTGAIEALAEAAEVVIASVEARAPRAR